MLPPLPSFTVTPLTVTVLLPIPAFALAKANVPPDRLSGALPLLEEAVQKLDGTGVLDEAYAKYNLAYTRYQLGNCDGVLDLLDQAEAIEGHKSAIDRLRAQAQENC